MIRVLTIIGARPQIIKAAAISRAIRTNFSDRLTEIIVHTGQHYDENMSGVFMQELNIPKEDYNLAVGSSSHGKQTAMMLESIEHLLIKEKPDAIIIYGDTNSTLAGGIAASKIHIPVIHIEAGLRSFNKKMPEEINRICCDHISTLLFSPTPTAIHNLEQEGFQTGAKPPYTIDHPGVFHCGDIMYDNSLYYGTIAAEKTTILKDLDLKVNDFVLATVHREENTDQPKNLNAIFSAFLEIANLNKLTVVIPVHPRTRKMMASLLEKNIHQQLTESIYIKFIQPVSFLEMTMLEQSCKMVLTDSGGVQKEAYFFKKPCLILREETEWVELVENGCATITGTDSVKIIESFTNFFHKKEVLNFAPVFGDGKAAEFICGKIIEVLS